MKWVLAILKKLDKPVLEQTKFKNVAEQKQINFESGRLEESFYSLYKRVSEISQPALENIEAASKTIQQNSYKPSKSLMAEILRGDYLLKNMRVKPSDKIQAQKTNSDEEEPVDIAKERNRRKEKSNTITEMYIRKRRKSRG